MPSYPWPGFIPEMNDLIVKTGIGSGAWAIASVEWQNFAQLVNEAIVNLTQEVTTLSGLWQGTAATAATAATTPFITWLGAMEVIAQENSMTCASVDTHFQGTLIAMTPAAVCTANRASEAALQGTNFMGVNSAAIAELDREYFGQFWPMNAGNGEQWGSISNAVTMPIPAPPPIPLVNPAGSMALIAGTAAGQTSLVVQAGMTAAEGGVVSAQTGILQAEAMKGKAVDGMNTVTETGQKTLLREQADSNRYQKNYIKRPTDTNQNQAQQMMQQMMSQGSQLMQMPMQMLQQGPQQLMQAPQQLMQGGQQLMQAPMQMMQSLMQNTSMNSALSSQAAPLPPVSGLTLSPAGLGGGGIGGGGFGGLGGTRLSGLTGTTEKRSPSGWEMAAPASAAAGGLKTSGAMSPGGSMGSSAAKKSEGDRHIERNFIDDVEYDEEQNSGYVAPDPAAVRALFKK